MSAATATAQTAFLEGAPDVPLPNGASALAASALEPAAPGGQHLVYIVGVEGPPEAVFAFYAETLPQLGWSSVRLPETGTVYVRGREQLSLRLLTRDGAEGRATLLIEVISSPASQALD